MIRTIAALALILPLAGCATQSTTPAGSAAPTTGLTLAQAQAESKVLLSAVQTGVQIYESAAPIDPNLKGSIDLALGSLTVAVNAFNGLSGPVNYITAGQAVLTTAQMVVATIPDLPASTKAAIQAGLVVVQAVLPLLPQPVPPA